jgi:hypothetical protein
VTNDWIVGLVQQLDVTPSYHLRLIAGNKDGMIAMDHGKGELWPHSDGWASITACLITVVSNRDFVVSVCDSTSTNHLLSTALLLRRTDDMNGW